MSRKCLIFKEETPIDNTLLTIVRPVYPPSWRMILCRCVCGTEIVVPYSKVYYATKYSCGCRKRVRDDAMDAAGMTVHCPTGNKDERSRPDSEGRRLTVISRDETTQHWWYMCHCCGEMFLLPGGQSHGVESMLRKLAAETCPNYKRFYPAEYDRMQGHWPVELGDLCAQVLKKMTLMPADIVRYYKDPAKSVVRDKFGFITGFRGLPDSDEFNDLYSKYRQSVIEARNKAAAPSAIQERELPHEDDFKEADY